MAETRTDLAKAGHLILTKIQYPTETTRWEIKRGNILCAEGIGDGSNAVALATWEAVVATNRMEGWR